jgi:very-short-patch-repair endonuclease
MAAVLRLKGDGLLSHIAAGFVWKMVEGEPVAVDVTVVGRQAHRVKGVRSHRVMRLDPRDVRWRSDLPVTSPARTVVDLAGVLDAHELENAVAVCREERLCSVEEIRRAMKLAPHSPGIGTLRRILDGETFSRTRSDYERRLLNLIEQAGLPRPLTNRRIAGHEVDMLWSEQKLVLEFDGFKFHSDRRAFERDRRRDQDLVARGYRVIRITARQLEEEPLAVIARLAVALAA